MSNFIVLGLVPGTNFQINFFTWLVLIALSPAVLYVVFRIRREQMIRFLLIRVSLTLAIRRQRA